MAASQTVIDLGFREMAVLAPLAVLMLVMGVAPNYWLRSIEKSSSPSGIVHQIQSVQPAPLNVIPPARTADPSTAQVAQSAPRFAQDDSVAREAQR